MSRVDEIEALYRRAFVGIAATNCKATDRDGMQALKEMRRLLLEYAGESPEIYTAREGITPREECEAVLKALRAGTFPLHPEADREVEIAYWENELANAPVPVVLVVCPFCKERTGVLNRHLLFCEAKENYDGEA